MTPYFTQIEALFASLLRDAELDLNARDREQVKEFLDHEEYGIALETIIAAYAEEKKVPTDRIGGLIEALATAMSMNPALLSLSSP